MSLKKFKKFVDDRRVDESLKDFSAKYLMQPAAKFSATTERKKIREFVRELKKFDMNDLTRGIIDRLLRDAELRNDIISDHIRLIASAKDEDDKDRERHNSAKKIIDHNKEMYHNLEVLENIIDTAKANL